MKQKKKKNSDIEIVRGLALSYGPGMMLMETLVQAVLTYLPARRCFMKLETSIHPDDLAGPSPFPDTLCDPKPSTPWPGPIADYALELKSDGKPVTKKARSDALFWQPDSLKQLVHAIWTKSDPTMWTKVSLNTTLHEAERAVRRAVAAAQAAVPAQAEAIARMGQIMLEQACSRPFPHQESRRAPIFVFSHPGHGVTYILRAMANALQGGFFAVSQEQTSATGLIRWALGTDPAIIQIHGFATREHIAGSAVHAILRYYQYGHYVVDHVSGIVTDDDEDSSEGPPQGYLLEAVLERSFVFIRVTPPIPPADAADYTPEEMVAMLREAGKQAYRSGLSPAQVEDGIWDMVRNWNSVVFRRTPGKDIVEQVMREFAHAQDNMPELVLAHLSRADHLRLAALFILERGFPSPKEIRGAAQRFLHSLPPAAREAKQLKFDVAEPEWEALFIADTPGSEAWFARLEGLAKQFNYRGNRLTAQAVYDDTGKVLTMTRFEQRAPRAISGNAYLQARPKLRFRDVAGHEEAKQRFRQILAYFKDPEPYRRLNVIPPLRILLHGPPGTGKTLLAQALAGETGLPFFAIAASEFMTREYAGQGATLMREFFQTAESCRPCIIFMDELDAFSARDQMSDGSAGIDFRGTLNTLLTLLDGVQSAPDILVIGATNRPEDLDPALLRPGRFGTRIQIQHLSARDRDRLIRQYLTPEQCAGDYEDIVAALCRRTTGGLSPVEIVQIIHEAKLEVIQQGRPHVTREDVMTQADRILLGKKFQPLQNGLRRATAIHEAGHAFLLRTLLPEQKLDRLSIGHREETVGMVRILDEEDPSRFLDRDDTLCQLLCRLGGMAAEETFVGHWDLGASDDFDVAVVLARYILTNIAMGDLGLHGIVRSRMRDESEPDTALEAMVAQLLERCRRLAGDIFKTHEPVLLKLARELELREDLEQDDVDRILAGVVIDRKAIVQQMLAPPAGS